MQSEATRRVRVLFAETVARHARMLGVSRRAFLASGAGLAAALLACNRAFGPFFTVDPAEALERDTARPPAPFVLDAHTRHVAAPRRFPALLDLRRRAQVWDTTLPRRPQAADLYLENYVREMFIESETAVAVLTGMPAAADAESALPVEAIAATRDAVTGLTGSRRVLTHGFVVPTRGAADLDEMARQAIILHVDAWKGSTGLPLGDPPRAWRVDDEAVAYPMLEASRRLGIRNICLHKGLPLTGTREADWHPGDVARAARDFPDLNFVVEHAAFRSLAAALPATRDEFRRTARVDWVTDLCELRERDPRLTNVYATLGTTFAMTVVTAPLLAAHILGMLVRHLDVDHVLWATDAIWWGSPRWQLEAFRRFQIPPSLAQRFGYATLTAELKARILGGNAARLYGVDPAAIRHPVAPDFPARLPRPSS